MDIARGDLDDPTVIAAVRLLISDTSDDPATQVLSDAEITALLGMYSGDQRLAAARALVVIATSETLLSKKIQTQDLTTDGPAVATALLAQAKDLRDEVQRDKDEDTWGVGLFDTTRRSPNPAILRQFGW